MDIATAQLGIARLVQEYVDTGREESNFNQQILDIGRDKTKRFKINIADVREKSPELAEGLLNEPCVFIPAFEDYVTACVRQQKGKITTDFVKPIRLAITGPSLTFGENDITPLELCSHFLRKTIRIYGIITKCSQPTARVQVLEQYSSHRKTFEPFEYNDPTINLTMRNNGIQRSVPPFYTVDAQGYPLTTDFGLSVFHDTQRIIIQTTPEDSPAGRIPRSVTATLVDELVDAVKPGDRVLATGVYLAYNSTRFGGSGSRNAIFRTNMLINDIECVGGSGIMAIPRSLIPDDINSIKSFLRFYENNRSDSWPSLLEMLGAALCPSVWGHMDIKRGLVLQLLKGETRHLSNGLRIRGDINIMLLGDPGTAKSQMLRYMSNMTPGAVCTTGRGTSGAGLTAAVISDNDSSNQGNGERRLEAGAMVLADRSLICIDEFDKMSDNDRTALHEAMEQQTVTVNKAGIHCTLNARCSVLAAANPPNGSYDISKPPQANINLPDSLLSRFDLIWIIIDTNSTATNTKIANHVLFNHLTAHVEVDGTSGTTGGSRFISRPHEDRGLMGDTAASTTFSSTSDDVTATYTNTPGNIMNGEEMGIIESSNAIAAAANDEPWAKHIYVQRDTKYMQIASEVLERLKTRRRIVGMATGDENENVSLPKTTDLRIINNEFFIKLLCFIKNLPAPKLSMESAALITNFYSELRMYSMTSNSTVPVTARTLETLIRLTIARAKLRVDNRRTTEEDVREVYALLRQSIFNESYEQSLFAAYGTTINREKKSLSRDNDNNNNNNNNKKDSNRKTKSIPKKRTMSGKEVNTNTSGAENFSSSKNSSTTQQRDSDVLNTPLATHDTRAAGRAFTAPTPEQTQLGASTNLTQELAISQITKSSYNVPTRENEEVMSESHTVPTELSNQVSQNDLEKEVTGNVTEAATDANTNRNEEVPNEQQEEGEELGNTGDISDGRFDLYKKIFLAILVDTRLSSISDEELMRSINTYCMNVDQEQFSRREHLGALRRLSDEEVVMVSEGFVYLLQ